MNFMAQATGEKASKAELKELAAWQAESPEAARFEGGAAAPAIWIGVALLCVLIIGLYMLFVDPDRIRPGS